MSTSGTSGSTGAGRDPADVLPPLQLPFTVLGGRAAGAGAARDTRSWGARLGVWWADSEEGEPGVVVTGVMKEGSAVGRLDVGDRITSADHEPIHSLGDLTRHLDRFGGSVTELTVIGAGGQERGVALRTPAPEGAAAAAGGAAATAARVPGVDLLRSLSDHIQCVLSNPVQREVTHPGVAADPDFGCLGADLEFSLNNVGLSEIRSAIVQCEPRLTDVQVDTVEFEVREEGETVTRSGIRVTGVLTVTGQTVSIDLEMDGLRRRRQAASRRVERGDAGLEQR